LDFGYQTATHGTREKNCVKSEAMQALFRTIVRAGTVSILLAAAGCASDSDPDSSASGCVVPIGTAPTRGPSDAWVTIVEFGDFQCYYCGLAEGVIHEVDALRPGVRWVFKHMPLPMLHANAQGSALAAECAKEQGQFWEMHDVLFAHQSALGDASLAGYAEGLGLDMVAWNDCRAAVAPAQRIAEDYKLAVAVGVRQRRQTARRLPNRRLRETN
jgi:hypothetical protein